VKDICIPCVPLTIAGLKPVVLSCSVYAWRLPIVILLPLAEGEEVVAMTFCIIWLGA
jgi:hypothetical protein